MNHLDYLLGFGVRGDYGRFRAASPLACRRGDRAVVRSRRGLEIAEVLRPTESRHAVFFPNTTVGTLLRLATDADEHLDAELRHRSQDLVTRANQVAGTLGLPLEVIDAELLLDRENAVVHHLHWEACDVRPLVSTIAREFAVRVELIDLTKADHHEDGCGSCGSGGCGSCGSGGCGTCGSANVEDVRAYFAGLRDQMERVRTPLL
jgi:cell fate regulator YaaT (PSP1 superfamily)